MLQLTKRKSRPGPGWAALFRRRGGDAPGSLKALLRSHTLRAYLYLLPFLIPFFVFSVYPLFSAINISLRKWMVMSTGPHPFVGLENYTKMLHDYHVGNALWNTVRYIGYYAIPTVSIGLGLALLLNRPIRFRSFFRTAFFTPVVTSTVAVSVVWRFLYQPTFGLFNLLLKMVGLPKLGWLTRPETAMLGIALMSVWKSVGYNMVLFLAGLQGIPEVFYEAARVDGASGWGVFRHITLPLLQRVTVFVIILTLIGSFQVFTQIWIMTKGGPIDSTMPLVQYIYDVAFGPRIDLGYASATAILLFGIILVLTLAQLWIGRTEWEY